MLRDLAVLTPPALVCVAFLVAVFAFLRREIRRPKNPADQEDGVVGQGIDNPPDQSDDAA